MTLLHEVVEAAPSENVALVHGNRTLTFGELAQRARSTAALAAEIAAPGEGIALIGDNHPAWVECQYGIPAAGRIAVFLNHRLATPELVSILTRSRARRVIGSAAELARLPPGLPRWTFDEWDDRAAVDTGPAPVPRPSADAPAWLIFTSGTTAEPKGAILTHASILAAVDVTARARPAAADDIYLLPFPLCHIAAYNTVHLHSRGRPVILLDRFEAGRFAEATARHRATTTSLAATMLASLLDLVEGDAAARDAVRSLRSVAYGAAPMPLPVLRRAHDVLGVDLAEGYGMTELSGNAVFLDGDAHRRGLAGETWLLGAAGRPGPGVAVRTVDDDGGDAAVGEIVVRGPQVMAGYWDSPSAVRDGWLHTGDVGRFDGEGWLYVVDRKKDVIVSGGENVSSLEVEAVLHACPGVREAAVVGIPDAVWGENVCAVVAAVRGTTIDPDDLVRRVRLELAGFKSPRHVVVVDELPKNGAGKIVKADLRAWLAEHPELLGVRR